MAQHDPKDVNVTRVSKRGEWYTVEGISGGKKHSVDIPADKLDGQAASKAEALMRRSLKGVSQMEVDRPRQ